MPEEGKVALVQAFKILVDVASSTPRPVKIIAIGARRLGQGGRTRSGMRNRVAELYCAVDDHGRSYPRDHHQGQWIDDRRVSTRAVDSPGSAASLARPKSPSVSQHSAWPVARGDGS